MPRRVEAKNGGRSSQGKEEEYWNILKMAVKQISLREFISFVFEICIMLMVRITFKI